MRRKDAMRLPSDSEIVILREKDPNALLVQLLYNSRHLSNRIRKCLPPEATTEDREELLMRFFSDVVPTLIARFDPTYGSFQHYFDRSLKHFCFQEQRYLQARVHIESPATSRKDYDEQSGIETPDEQGDIAAERTATDTSVVDFEREKARLLTRAKEKPTLRMVNAEEVKAIEDWKDLYPGLALFIEVTKEDFSRVFEGKLIATAENSIEFLDLDKEYQEKGAVCLTAHGNPLDPRPIPLPPVFWLGTELPD